MLSLIFVCFAVAVNSASLNIKNDNLILKSERFIYPDESFNFASRSTIVNGTFTVPLDHSRPQDGRTADLVRKS